MEIKLQQIPLLKPQCSCSKTALPKLYPRTTLRQPWIETSYCKIIPTRASDRERYQTLMWSLAAVKQLESRPERLARNIRAYH